MHKGDIAFLQDYMSYEVIEDPMAHAVISSSTFLFAPRVPEMLPISFSCIDYPSVIVSHQNFDLKRMYLREPTFVLRHVPAVKDFWITRTRARLDGKWGNVPVADFGKFSHLTDPEWGILAWNFGNSLYWAADEHNKVDENIVTYYEARDDWERGPPEFRNLVPDASLKAANAYGTPIIFFPNGRFDLVNELKALMRTHPNADGDSNRRLLAIASE